MPLMSNTYPSSLLCTLPSEIDHNLSFLPEMPDGGMRPGFGYGEGSTYPGDPHVELQSLSLFAQASV